jgi:ABC-type amino acid transport substrate-binding protein
VTVRAYPSSGERDLDLKAGRIDAGFDSGVYGTAMLAKPGNDDLQMTGPLMKGAMLATEVALGMRKGETDLKEKFDAAIKSAAQAGVIRSLSQKWSKLDLTPSFDAN